MGLTQATQLLSYWVPSLSHAFLPAAVINNDLNKDRCTQIGSVMANFISHLSFKPSASREEVERKLRHNRETDRKRKARMERPLRLSSWLLAVRSFIVHQDLHVQASYLSRSFSFSSNSFNLLGRTSRPRGAIDKTTETLNSQN